MTTAEVTTQKPIVLGPNEGSLVNLFGNPLLVRLPREVTDNKFWLAEYTLTPGFDGPPPHLHQRTHEVFYVLDGELGMLVGDKEVVIGAGGLAMVPPARATPFTTRAAPPAASWASPPPVTSAPTCRPYRSSTPGTVSRRPRTSQQPSQSSTTAASSPRGTEGRQQRARPDLIQLRPQTEASPSEWRGWRQPGEAKERPLNLRGLSLFAGVRAARSFSLAATEMGDERPTRP